MRTRLLTALVLATGAVAVAAPRATAQVTIRRAPGSVRMMTIGDDENRAVIGVTTASSDARDTLGLRVSDVASGSPADKAGIQEGDRLVSVNGVSLKLASADVGDPEMSDALNRRLVRELGKLKPGDEANVQLLSGGQVKAVKVKTVSAADLYDKNLPMRATRVARNEADTHAALGISFMSSSSKRDTLGVLVMGVDDDGPANKAGIEEGNRIASINGVSLRVSRDDAGDEEVATSRVNRLEREMAKVKPGDDVSLQVYTDGHFKTVKVKAVRESDLKSRQRSFIIGDGNGMMRMGPGGLGSFNFNIDGDQMHFDGEQLRMNIQRAMEGMRTNLESLHGLDGLQNIDDTVRARLNDRLRELRLEIPRLRERIYNNYNDNNDDVQTRRVSPPPAHATQSS